MAQDDAAARRARADRLRKQIAELTRPKRTGRETAPDDSPPEGGTPESPRDLIEEKMRQLDRRSKRKRTRDA
ncbi:MAG TPA: hypothetical protein VEI06_02795 [Gemmatimonadaceae bacterium]|nr:hypothetical protein [Gemmatimonadaceae bacterium]